MIFRYGQFGQYGQYGQFGAPAAASESVRPQQMNIGNAAATLSAALAGKLKLDSAGIAALRDTAAFYESAYTTEQKARVGVEKERDSARGAAADRTRERDSAISERDTARGLAATREKERDAAANLAYTREKERDAAISQRDAAGNLAFTREKERDKALGERDNARGERDSAANLARQREKERDDAYSAIGQRDATIGAVVKERDSALGIAKQREDALAQKTTELSRAMDRINATDAALAQAAKVADLVPGLQSQLQKISAAFEAATKDRDAAINLANTRGTELGKAIDEVNNRGRTIDDLAVRLKDTGAALDAAAARAALIPGLEAKLQQINDAALALQRERDNAIAETGRVRDEAGREIENQRGIGQRMLDEANKNAADKLAQAQIRVEDLERGKLGVEALAGNLQEKLERLRQQYDERTAADAAQAKSALEAAQADLQKARDVCAADLGAAAEAKKQVEALLAAAQDEANKCALRQQEQQPITAAPAKPGINPALALVGGIIAGFAVSKASR